MNVKQHLSTVSLAPRKTAGEYAALYKELKSTARQVDNDHDQDLSIRAGEVVVRGFTEDGVYLNFGYQRDEGYVGESLSLHHTQVDEEGKRKRVDSLRAGVIDKQDHLFRFTHLVDLNGDLSYEQVNSVLVDTEQGTVNMDTFS